MHVNGDDASTPHPKTGRAPEQMISEKPITVRFFGRGHSHLWSPQVLRRSQEVGNDRTALLHPFELLIQPLNTASRIRDELLLGRRTRVPCIGRRKRVRADAGLSEHVGEGLHDLIERCQVRWEKGLQ